MRLHIAVGLAATLATLALTACSDGSDSSETAPATEPAAEASDGLASEAAVPEASPAPTATPTPEASATASPEPAPAPTPKASAAPLVAAAPVAPPAAFARCAVCHTAGKGEGDKLGPNLFGVFGKAMGQGNFAFSEALKASALTMDEATLDKWLENPRALVPGNRMSFPGLKDAAKRKEIIDYLKQQR